MPEPFNDFACDRPIYNILKTVAPNLCFINPTFVTFVNGIISTVIIYKITQKQDFMLLFIIRVILDMLDGTIARTCNKITEFGGYLDQIVDDIFYPCALIAILITYDRFDIFHVTAVGLLFIMYKKSKVVYEFLHDNSILLPFVYILLIKYIEISNGSSREELDSYGIRDEIDPSSFSQCEETKV